MQINLRAIFIFLMIARCTFIAIPDSIVWNTFQWPSEEMKDMKLFQFTFRFWEYITLFGIMLLLWAVAFDKIVLTWNNKIDIAAFTIITGADIADFILRGNSEWFWAGSYPVTNNVFMIPAFWLISIVFSRYLK